MKCVCVSVVCVSVVCVSVCVGKHSTERGKREETVRQTEKQTDRDRHRQTEREKARLVLIFGTSKVEILTRNIRRSSKGRLDVG